MMRCATYYVLFEVMYVFELPPFPQLLYARLRFPAECLLLLLAFLIQSNCCGPGPFANCFVLIRRRRNLYAKPLIALRSNDAQLHSVYVTQHFLQNQRKPPISGTVNRQRVKTRSNVRAMQLLRWCKTQQWSRRHRCRRGRRLLERRWLGLAAVRILCVYTICSIYMYSDLIWSIFVCMFPYFHPTVLPHVAYTYTYVLYYSSSL